MRFDWKPVLAAALISGAVFGTGGYFLGSAGRGDAYMVSGSDNTAAYVYEQEDAEETPPAAESKTIVQTDDTETAPTEKVNINTADLEALQTLSGIGEVKAQAIIDYREENGDFEKIEDITNVSGIGEATLAEIYDEITVD